MRSSVEAQEDTLRTVLGVADVQLYDVGGETRTYRVGDHGDLATVAFDWPASPNPDLERDAELLRRVAARVSVPVPTVVSVAPVPGVLTVRPLPGRRLIDVTDRSTMMTGRATDEMARTLAELHACSPTTFADVVPTDTTPPTEWRDEAADHAGVVDDELTSGQRTDVRAFLARPAPDPTTGLRFTHNDLGIEHVLVDAADGGDARVTGIIDWSDAAITDPAVDVGRLLRDLGRDSLARAMRVYSAHGGDPDTVAPRAGFYAACGLLEDLAFGLAHGRREYVEKCWAAWDSVFRARA